MRLRRGILVAGVFPVLAIAFAYVALGGAVSRPVSAALAVGLVAAAIGVARLRAALHVETARLREAAGRLAAAEQGGTAANAVPGELAELATELSRASRFIPAALRDARERQQETEAVFSRMADGILVVDTDLRIRRLNPAAAHLLALVPEGAIGQSVIEATMLHALDGLFREALAAGETRSRRLEVFQPRRRLLQVLVTPVEGAPSGTGAVAVLQDLTELERIERVRRDFVTNVSHELRTPVASIKVMVESLQRGALRDLELAEEFLRSIADAADRLVRLVDDVLALARIEAGPGRQDWQPVRLDELVRGVLASQQPLAREQGVTLRLSAEGDPVLTGDAEALRQAVANLVTNGIKYNRPGGEVRVSLQREPGFLFVRVADTGIGIPAEHLPRIFERFYRVDQGRAREPGGTGLGLAIVRHVAEAHGGSVSVQSTPGKGSAFILKLPADPASCGSDRARPSRAAPAV